MFSTTPPGAIRVPALAVAAARDRDLEPALARVLEDGLELFHLAGVVQPLDPGGGEARDIGPQERIVPVEQVLV